MDLPDPPVPMDADLRHFPAMMIEVTRLLRSEFIMSASKAGIGAAFILWCSAWHEVPAGSLPKNERIRAKLALCDWEEWKQVRDEAMNGYVLCSDQRYHHTTGAVFVLDAIKRSLVASEKGRKGAAARWNPRNGTGNAPAIAQALPEDATVSPLVLPKNANGRDRKGSDRKGSDQKGSPARAREAPGSLGDAFPDSVDPALASLIWKSFTGKSDHGGFTWPPSERDHINRVVEHAIEQPEPYEWAESFIESAWRCYQGQKGIWKGRPWVPRLFCGPKAMDWVIQAMNGQQVDPEVSVALADAAKRMVERGKNER